MGTFLLIIAVFIFWISSLILYPWILIKSLVKKNLKEFDRLNKKIAIEIDELGNLIFADFFNLILIKKQGFRFGNDEETISSVLGKNKLKGTLSDAGIVLAWILNNIDKNHVEKSIKL